jgi:hypothetical protein
MSRLYFAPLNEAFYLRSDNIKDTKTEIDNLKKLITDSTNKVNQVSKIEEKPNKQTNLDKRIGYSDQVNANFKKGDQDMDLLKIMQHPKFDDIVKSYLIVKYPELVNQQLNNTTYNAKSVSTFGQGYSTTFCSNIKNYTIFFIFSLIIYLFLEKVLKK